MIYEINIPDEEIIKVPVEDDKIKISKELDAKLGLHFYDWDHFQERPWSEFAKFLKEEYPNIKVETV